MLVKTAKIFSMVLLVCGIIGIQTQLSQNNIVFANTLIPCCNNNICNGMGCDIHSSYKDSDGDEFTITCRQCMEMDLEGHTYCVESNGCKYDGNGYYDCPPPSPLTGSISGPAVISTPEGKYDPALSYTWTASVSGGNAPYTYTWYKTENGQESQVGSGSSYTESYRWAGSSLPEFTTFTLRVEITDTAIPGMNYSGQSISTSLGITLYYGNTL